MALTTNHTNNELIKFRRNVATDFLRASRLDPFMGPEIHAVFQELVLELQVLGRQKSAFAPKNRL